MFRLTGLSPLFQAKKKKKHKKNRPVKKKRQIGLNRTHVKIALVARTSSAGGRSERMRELRCNSVRQSTSMVHAGADCIGRQHAFKKLPEILEHVWCGMNAAWSTLTLAEAEFCCIALSNYDVHRSALDKTPASLAKIVVHIMNQLPASARSPVCSDASTNIQTLLLVVTWNFDQLVSTEANIQILHACFKHIAFGLVNLLESKVGACCAIFFGILKVHTRAVL